MAKKVDPLAEFVRVHSEEIVVELRKIALDGKPYAVRMRQPNGMEWLGFAGGVPSGMTEMNPELQKKGEAPRTDFQEKMRRMVARAVTHVRAPAPGGEEWLPVRVVLGVPSPDADPREISIDVLDRVDNVTRCFNALVADIAGGGDMSVTEADGFRDERGALGGAGRGRRDVRRQAV